MATGLGGQAFQQISNASDALDKLRFRSLTEPALMEGEQALVVRIRVETERASAEGARLWLADTIGIRCVDLANAAPVEQDHLEAMREGIDHLFPAPWPLPFDTMPLASGPTTADFRECLAGVERLFGFATD